MNTLPLSPRLRIPIPERLRWFLVSVVVALSLLTWLMLWSVIDLWQLATWPRAHLEQGGGIEPKKLLKLALFGFTSLLCLVAFTVWAVAYHFGFVGQFPRFAEWFSPVFVLTFFYFSATGIRF